MKTKISLQSIMACFVLGTAMFLTGCSKSNDNNNNNNKVIQPTLITLTPTAITRNSVTLGGDVISLGNQTIRNWGVAIDVNANPSLEKNGMYTTFGSGLGRYTRDISPLPPNTTYHVRACIQTTTGTAYGDDLTFTTLP